jgi:DNA ligase D-like protein (predicted ligase)
MPDWMKPMLAQLTHDHFSGDDWIFERKLDGERVLAFIEPKGRVRLMSRNKKEINDHYPEVAGALRELAPRGCILDGEVVAMDEHGVSDFQKLQPRMQTSSSKEARKKTPVYYYIFDCLYIEGHDITKCSLRTRKSILRKAVDWHDPLRFTRHRNDDGLEYYKEACEKGWEGLIAKHSGSSYAHSRSKNWLKFKCVMEQELVICGFTEPHGKRIGFGALQLGFYRDGKLVYAGEVGTGYDEDTLQSLRKRLDSMERDSSPYDVGSPEKKEVHFVEPKLVCEVAFTAWTEDDKLRHPRFKGLREDKKPKDVHKEASSQAAEV